MSKRVTAFICQLGCEAECRHHHTCVVFGIDRAHPHPSQHGHLLHFAMTDDGLMHEWRGKAGQCKVFDPADDERA
jgi:hypothetical protein